MSQDLRYPIGKFERPREITPEMLQNAFADIAALPARLREAVAGLSEQQLDTPYRPDGWTVRQVVHHYADSHMNSFVRFKLALTEDRPTIKPYAEERWAELPDGRTAPIELSLELVEGLHARWSILLGSLDAAALAREFVHPEAGTLPLDVTATLYAWHSRHHVAQIQALRQRMGW